MCWQNKTKHRAAQSDSWAMESTQGGTAAQGWEPVLDHNSPAYTLGPKNHTMTRALFITGKHFLKRHLWYWNLPQNNSKLNCIYYHWKFHYIFLQQRSLTKMIVTFIHLKNATKMHPSKHWQNVHNSALFNVATSFIHKNASISIIQNTSACTHLSFNIWHSGQFHLEKTKYCYIAKNR